MFKILMCNCNRYRLNQLEVPYTYPFIFDDFKCLSEHEFFALKCERNCRPYFSSICCRCPDEDKDRILEHCKRLSYSLNNDTIKVFLKKEDLPKELILIKLDSYLQKYINADRHFFFLKRIVKLKLQLIRLIEVTFFLVRKLCKILAYSR